MNARGKNFTEREKCKLLEIVHTYKSIIENKCTNAISSLKKNEAWESITNDFNSTAETPRTQKQLNTAYLNLKRSTRQNIANDNVQRYLEQKQKHDDNQDLTEPLQVITIIDETNRQNELEIHDLLKQLKKDEIADKKGVRATGGGTYKPMLSSVGAQMLAVMGDQLTPLSNNCDSASSYYNIDNAEQLSMDVQVSTPSVPSVPITVSGPQESSKPRTKRSVPQRKNKENNHLTKKQYYNKKLQSAIIEKNTKVIEYKMALKRQKLLDLEIKIKQKEYENLLNK